LKHLLDMERLAATQEWWMYGRVLPEAPRVAELTSLLAAARAELVGLLKSMGFPQIADTEHLGAGALTFASQFASGLGSARAHRGGSLQVVGPAASAVPVLLVQGARLVNRLDGNVSGTMARRVLSRITARPTEARTLATGHEATRANG
jgi:hypothetical protein